MQDVDSSGDGAKPFVTWAVFSDGVISAAFVVAKSDL
jgi:hypothetical protein